MANKLGLQKEEANISITGISNIKSNVRHKAWIRVFSRYSSFKIELNCLVSRKIIGILPTFEIDIASWNIPSGILLADPTFYKPGQVDLLIGMEWFNDLMKPGRVKLSENLPIFLDSHFGWLVGEKITDELISGSVAFSHTAISSSDQLSFWKLESVDIEQSVPSEAEECEAHFQSSFRRTSEGRCVVQLPLRETCKQLS
ncbi:uncharacterized protein LOC134222351 [Armigeres subalbatus]|uniref:uncharacterized protein LOC134222351 n=1 Tax=Armigeres subalbatus TaxID=124917 RepID=UPI002ED2036E